MIKRKSDKLYVKWKAYDSSFNSWINKNDLVWFCWLQFHCIKNEQTIWASPKPYKQFDRELKLDLSNYATKTNIKNISHIDSSRFALKTNLATLKTEVDKLDIDKLVPVPVDLSYTKWCFKKWCC